MSLSQIREFTENASGFVKLVGNAPKAGVSDYKMIKPILKFKSASGFLVDGKWGSIAWMDGKCTAAGFIATFDQANPATRGMPGSEETIKATGFIPVRYINQDGLDYIKRCLIEYLVSKKVNREFRESMIELEISLWKPGKFKALFKDLSTASQLIPAILEATGAYGIRCEIELEPEKGFQSACQFLFLSPLGIQKMKGLIQ